MKKKMSDKTKVVVAFVCLLLLGIVKDFTSEDIIKNGLLHRGAVGEKEEEIQLQLDVENLLEDYDYFLEVSSKVPTQEEAEIYFTGKE